ncbi:hypothetical protein OAU99_02950 [Candidatus Poseidoniaceae archaeon]|jgi:hypothetical protein|nr:hypothetical protein [Candidatus Poseidoniaceae archaeon]
MISTTIAIYSLGAMIVLLSGLLTSRALKRRKSKPENIWELNSSIGSNNTRAPNNVPIKAPPANVFYNR